MIRHIALVLTLTVLGCGTAPSPTKPPTSSTQPTPTEQANPASQLPDLAADISPDDKDLGEYVTFRAAGIRIRQPEGFELADSFDGFGVPLSRTTIVAVSNFIPYSHNNDGWTAANLATRGWKLHSREEVDLGGMRGVLLHFDQPVAGQIFSKWTVLSGNESRSIVVTATVQREEFSKFASRMKASLLSLRRLEDLSGLKLEDELPFTLQAPPKLKRTAIIPRMIGFTKDGIIPIKSPGDPMFGGGTAISEVTVGDPKQFAERRIRQTARTSNLVIESTEPITLDGLDGFESIATAIEPKSGTPLIVYQMVLFGDDSYILLQGIVGAKLRDEYLPAFLETARSLKRK